MTDVSERRMGRPPKTSREQILDAAAVFDASDLQLTTLADSLGISVKTLYNYFPNRRALLDALTERAVELRSGVAFERCSSTREVLEQVGRWAYDLGRTQPGWYLSTAAPRGVTLRVIADYLDRMAALGAPEADALTAFGVVSNFALASGEAAHRTEAAGGLGAENVHAQPDDYGDPAAVARILPLMADTDLDSWFERGLSAVLTGVHDELLPVKSRRRRT